MAAKALGPVDTAIADAAAAAARLVLAVRAAAFEQREKQELV